MNNPKTQETLDTRHRTKTKKATTKNTTQKTKMMSNKDPWINQRLKDFI
jgi:hypothetical protein